MSLSPPGFMSWCTAYFVNDVIKATQTERIVEIPDWEMDASKATQVLETAWLEEKTLNKKSPSLTRALWRAFRNQFLFAAFLKLCWGAFVLAGVAYFVRSLLAYIRYRSTDPDHTTAEEGAGIALCFGFLLCMLFLSLSLQQMSIVSARLGLRVEAAMAAIIYKKSLTYDRSTESAEVTSLVSNDCSKLGEACTMLQYLWSGAIEAIAIIAILLGFVGRAALPGLGVVLFLIPVQYLIGALTANARKRSVAASEERVRFMREVLTSMKLVKMYVWEVMFAKRVAEERSKEAAIQYFGGVLKSINFAIVFAAPPLIALSIFGLYVLEAPLEASLAFTTLSLFNTLRLPLVLLPKGLRAAVEAKTATERISAFLLLPDRVPHASVIPSTNVSSSSSSVLSSTSEIVEISIENSNPPHPLSLSSSSPAEKGLVQLTNASFAPGEGLPNLLTNVTLTLKPGSLTVITGSVGTGKSNLLLSILGQMRCVQGQIRSVGKFAYVPQTPWCALGSVRDNILFGKEWDEKRYRAVIYACALERDLTLLEDGDLTEIGERGMNLSGGQRQRIACARAVYSKADIVLLDAPLSAVDAYTSQHMFKHAIGLLRAEGSTVILVTHQVELIPRADSLIVMKDGSVVFSGLPSREVINTYFPSSSSRSTVITPIDHSKSTKRLSIKSSSPRLRPILTLRDIKDDDIEDMTGIDDDDEEEEEDIRLGPSTPKFSGEKLRSRAPSIDVRMISRHVSVISTLAASSSELPLESAIKRSTERLSKSVKTQQGGISSHGYFSFATELGLFYLTFVVFVFIVTQLTRIYSDIWISSWVLKFYSNRPEMWYVAIYSGYVAAFIVFLIIRGLLFFAMFRDAASRMHDVMSKALLRAPMSFFNLTPLGSLLSVISRDMDTLSDALVDNDYLTLVYLMILGTTIGVVVTQVRIFLVVVAVLITLSALVCMRYVAASKVLKTRAGTTFSAVVAHVSESVQGIAVIQAFGAEKRYVDAIVEKLLAAQISRFTMETLQLWLTVRQDLIGSLMVFGTCIMCVSLEKTLSPAAAGLAISNSFQILLFLSLMVRTAASAHDMMASVDRVRALGLIVKEPDEGKDTAPEGWPRKGDIQFNNVEMSYVLDAPPVLKGLSFSVRAGEKIGIVGRTGAGKSSLIQAIFRLAPITENSITVDGVNTSQLSLSCLRKNIAILPQEPVMFEGTLRSNLDPFNLLSDAVIEDALSKCLLGDIVKTKDGLSQKVTSMGANFSLGQQQLVCLARALLNESSLLLLDEATAALDSETDEKVQRVLRTSFSSRTILTIAHRIDTIIDSDRILVIDAGKVVEFAPPQELIQTPTSIFAELCRQSGVDIHRSSNRSRHQSLDDSPLKI